MRLKDYLATYAEPGPKGIVRGVTEWLEEQAREQARKSAFGGEQALKTAANALRDQTECWP